MTIAFFVLYFVLFVITIAHFAKPSNASAANYTRGNEVTSESRRDYYPPRIQQLCYDNWYGADWNKSMKYEKRCRVLWTAWTEEEKSHGGISR